jgi:hypothetical protein
MSGTPTEAEIQAQWKNVVDTLETTRALIDGTHAGSGGLWDAVIQSLEGDYTPAALADWVNDLRATCSSLISPQRALEALTPILFEYANRIESDASGTQGFGVAQRTVGELFRALYDWFVAKSYTVESRAITYDTSATAGGSNVGNGAMGRLTVDENAFNLEACTVERKLFKCVADKNSGVQETAEVFVCSGEPASFDSILRASFGSGTNSGRTIVSKNAGSGSGGSLLSNSSFSSYDSGASPKFSGWTESAGGAQVSQDLTAFYRTHPGSQTDASLKVTGGGGTVTLKQGLDAMRIRRLDVDTPYQFRVMFNPTPGSASGGTLTIRCGSNSKSIAVASMAGGWEELILDFDENLWFRSFNEDTLDVEIEWSSSTSGYLLIDDAIFAPLDLIDGTYWFLRATAASPAAWLVDDILAFTDTGGAPTTAKFQWWLWVAGLGYLPSSGSPTLSDP